MPPEPTPAKIRAWAVEQGLEVAERGRIAADLRQAYDAAHPPRQRRAPEVVTAGPSAVPPASSGDPDPKFQERLVEAERRIAVLEERVQTLAAPQAEKRRFMRRG